MSKKQFSKFYFTLQAQAQYKIYQKNAKKYSDLIKRMGPAWDPHALSPFKAVSHPLLHPNKSQPSALK